jgi:hypothetical protein
MLNFAIDDSKNKWTLKKSNGKVELWYDNINKVYGVYLHEQPQQWIMQAIVKTEQEADRFFIKVIDMVK